MSGSLRSRGATVAQLSGSSARLLFPSALALLAAGAHQVNLNMGCPASSAQAGEHGAALMRAPGFPDQVALLRAALERALTAPAHSHLVPPSRSQLQSHAQGQTNATNTDHDHFVVPLSAKFRLGVDAPSHYPSFLAFLCGLCERAGIAHVVAHARTALLRHSPKDNLSVPPLRPLFVARARADLRGFLHVLTTQRLPLLAKEAVARGWLPQPQLDNNNTYVITNADDAAADARIASIALSALAAGTVPPPPGPFEAVIAAADAAAATAAAAAAAAAAADTRTHAQRSADGRAAHAAARAADAAGARAATTRPAADEDEDEQCAAVPTPAALVRSRAAPETLADAALAVELYRASRVLAPELRAPGAPSWLRAAVTAAETLTANADATVSMDVNVALRPHDVRLDYNGGVSAVESALHRLWAVPSVGPTPHVKAAPAAETVPDDDSSPGDIEQTDASESTTGGLSERQIPAPLRHLMSRPPLQYHNIHRTVTHAASSACSTAEAATVTTTLSALDPAALSAAVDAAAGFSPPPQPAAACSGGAAPSASLLGAEHLGAVMVGRAAQGDPMFPAYFDAAVAALAAAADAARAGAECNAVSTNGGVPALKVGAVAEADAAHALASFAVPVPSITASVVSARDVQVVTNSVAGISPLTRASVLRSYAYFLERLYLLPPLLASSATAAAQTDATQGRLPGVLAFSDQDEAAWAHASARAVAAMSLSFDSVLAEFTQTAATHTANDCANDGAHKHGSDVGFDTADCDADDDGDVEHDDVATVERALVAARKALAKAEHDAIQEAARAAKERSIHSKLNKGNPAAQAPSHHQTKAGTKKASAPAVPLTKLQRRQLQRSQPAPAQSAAQDARSRVLNLERRLQRLCEDLPALDLRLGSALGPLIGAARALQPLFASAVPRADGRGGRAARAGWAAVALLATRVTSAKEDAVDAVFLSNGDRRALAQLAPADSATSDDKLGASAGKSTPKAAGASKGESSASAAASALQSLGLAHPRGLPALAVLPLLEARWAAADSAAVATNTAPGAASASTKSRAAPLRVRAGTPLDEVLRQLPAGPLRARLLLQQHRAHVITDVLRTVADAAEALAAAETDNSSSENSSVGADTAGSLLTALPPATTAFITAAGLSSACSGATGEAWGDMLRAAAAPVVSPLVATELAKWAWRETVKAANGVDETTVI